MECYKYMKIPINTIPEEIMLQYNLSELVHTNNLIHIEICKGMYSLLQAGRITNDQLQQHLNKYGYIHSETTNNLWTHKIQNTVFTLAVDNLGVCYSSKADTDHLISALQDLYKITLDWKGVHLIGIDLAWNYNKDIYDLPMPKYVEKGLKRFLHRHMRSTNTLSSYRPHFGKNSQMALPPPPKQLELTGRDNTFIQQVVGTFLYYGRVIDPTVLHALSAIAVSREYGMKSTLDATMHLLNYLATHPDALLRYHASDMVLFSTLTCCI